MSLTGIDYKQLMDDHIQPGDVLESCLTAANIKHLAKLATQIPDKVSICLQHFAMV